MVTQWEVNRGGMACRGHGNYKLICMAKRMIKKLLAENVTSTMPVLSLLYKVYQCLVYIIA